MVSRKSKEENSQRVYRFGGGLGEKKKKKGEVWDKGDKLSRVKAAWRAFICTRVSTVIGTIPHFVLLFSFLFSSTLYRSSLLCFVVVTLNVRVTIFYLFSSISFILFSQEYRNIFWWRINLIIQWANCQIEIERTALMYSIKLLSVINDDCTRHHA